MGELKTQEGEMKGGVLGRRLEPKDDAEAGLGKTAMRRAAVTELKFRLSLRNLRAEWWGAE